MGNVSVQKRTCLYHLTTETTGDRDFDSLHYYERTYSKHAYLRSNDRQIPKVSTHLPMKAMRRKPPRPFELNGASRQVNESGAAQAARCLAYTAEFHPNVEPNGPHNAVVFE